MVSQLDYAKLQMDEVTQGVHVTLEKQMVTVTLTFRLSLSFRQLFLSCRNFLRTERRRPYVCVCVCVFR